MNSTSPLQEHGLAQVIDGGYCIGCGTCAAIEGSPVKIQLTDTGKYQATISGIHLPEQIDQKIRSVCPFSGDAPNEDVLGEALYSKDCRHDVRNGYWRGCYIGHVEQDDFRQRGSSGGIVTWLACHLLEADEIDAVIHVTPAERNSEDSVLFKYATSTTPEKVRSGAKSRYYAVEMSQVLDHVRKDPGRYLLVGVPCFIKAVRLLNRTDEVFAQRIRYTVAILCGHLKSIEYLNYLAWQLGIRPDEIQSFDFRHKMPNKPASSYAIQAVRNTGDGQQTITSLMKDLRGEDWGLGLFKYEACDFCDDVMGETADISCGDAWIEPYSSDSRGTSVIVIRNVELHRRIASACEAGHLQLTAVTPEIVSKTQEASFRHRREGLSFRLSVKERSGLWAPPKRVSAGWRHLTRKYRKIFTIRQALVAVSDAAIRASKEKADFSHYWPQISPLARRYHRCYHPLWIAIPRRLWRMTRKLANRS